MVHFARVLEQITHTTVPQTGILNHKCSTVRGTMNFLQYRSRPLIIKKSYVSLEWPIRRQERAVSAIRVIGPTTAAHHLDGGAVTYVPPTSTFLSRPLSLPFGAQSHNRSRAGQLWCLQGPAWTLFWPPHLPAHHPGVTEAPTKVDLLHDLCKSIMDRTH